MIKSTIIGGLGLGLVIPAALDLDDSMIPAASSSSSSLLFPSPAATSSPSCSYADLGPWAFINEDEKLAIEQLGRLKRVRLMINDGIISNNHGDYCHDYNMGSCTSSRGSFPNTPRSSTNPRLTPSSWRTLSASSVDIESMEGIIKPANLLIKEVNPSNHDEEVSKYDYMRGDNQDSESDFEERSGTPRYKLLADLYTSCPLIQPLITEIKRPIRKGDQRKRKAVH